MTMTRMLLAQALTGMQIWTSGLLLNAAQPPGSACKHELKAHRLSAVIQMYPSQSACDGITDSALEKSGPLWHGSIQGPHTVLDCHWTLKNSLYIFISCFHWNYFSTQPPKQNTVKIYRYCIASDIHWLTLKIHKKLSIKIPRKRVLLSFWF